MTIDTAAARVVALAPGNFEASITIDRGRRHGVKKDMPVVSGAGLVGRVLEVYGGCSKALVLTDPRVAVGIRLAKSRETGVTRGLAGKDILDVDLIDPDVNVEENELVVTSGLEDARYPSGIPVGTVASVSTPGVLVTITPRISAATTSTLLYPTATLATMRSFGRCLSSVPPTQRESSGTSATKSPLGVGSSAESHVTSRPANSEGSRRLFSSAATSTR